MRLTALGFALLLIGCNEQTGHEHYNLVRSSLVIDESFHVATFDADEGNDYNFVNCNAFAEAAMQQPGVIVRYWCERD